jgi:hypothetical protein
MYSKLQILNIIFNSKIINNVIKFSYNHEHIIPLQIRPFSYFKLYPKNYS